MMNFLRSLINGCRHEIQQREADRKRFMSEIEEAFVSLEALFSDAQNFIEPQTTAHWISHNTQILNLSEEYNIPRLGRGTLHKELLSKHSDLLKKAEQLPQRIQRHNHRAAEMKLQEAYALIGDVEGRKLDSQQMICIVKEVQNHLVIAGAGTGKTTTVVGKVKYLLKSGKCQPQDILVLSFTNASATEMCKRIQAETGEDISAITFHKLGLNIISKADGRMPKITKLDLRRFIKEQIEQEMRSSEYLKLLNTYLLYNRTVEKSEFEFQTKQEYEEYLSLNPPTTINNEVVKSYGEMDIANYLTQNGIRYIYEHPYVIDTRTSSYGQYYPDFYLPEYELYIEYFGINRSGDVPSYFSGRDGMSASQAYRESMAWKRRLHQENHTVMIECFAYEKAEGTLLDTLEKKLKDAAVVFQPQTPEEVWKHAAAEGNSVLEGLVELFQTLINLMKGNGYHIETVRDMSKGSSHRKANDIILSLLEPIYNSYCADLKQKGEIDFNDMINLAAQYIQQGKYVNPYQYVIVDEYQDISHAQFRMLDSLRKSRNYALFCVGDDWQSIYRFAGSDIGYILDFEKYWGASEISKIETTYRFSQKLIEIAGGFIMRNPAQIKKAIYGKGDVAGFPLGEISGYTERNAIQFMEEKLMELPSDSSVFFIGRYSFDEKILSDSGLFSCHYNNVNQTREVRSGRRPDLKMQFLTAHKSKGLEADYVFIINNKKSKMGFPSKIQDAPILNLLLDGSDQFPYAEERRLFYVSLTRAKKKAYIVTVSNQESEFVMELKEHYGTEIKQEMFTCPRCGGRLLRRSGPYGDFLGCSNYFTMGCTYKKKIGSRKKQRGFEERG